MKILIDARKIRDGGIGTYLRNLIAGLLAVDSGRIGVICRDEADLPPAWRGRITPHIDNTRCYSLRELFRFPDRAVLAKYGLLHIPHYTLPFGIKIPTVITVHDLIHIDFPERAYYPYFAGPLIRSALRRAAKVIAVSQATRDAIAEFVHGDQSILEKITVIQNAVDPSFFERIIQSEDSASQPSAEPYFFSICSTAKPHKGTRALLDAFTIYKSRFGAGHKSNLNLIIAGDGAREEYSNDGGKPISADIKFVGPVTSERLKELYAGATALVVPSRAEGFSLPVIEAQALRVPVITTPVPAIEELITDYDTVAEDFSPQALANAMHESFGKRALPKDGVAEDIYRRHLARFDFRSVAAQTKAIYTVAGGGHAE